MLRISPTETAVGEVKLRIDGQISGRWVRLLQNTCEDRLARGLQVSIDLRNVSFVDREGIVLLRRLADRRVEFMNVLPFISEQIKKSGS